MLLQSLRCDLRVSQGISEAALAQLEGVSASPQSPLPPGHLTWVLRQLPTLRLAAEQRLDSCLELHMLLAKVVARTRGGGLRGRLWRLCRRKGRERDERADEAQGQGRGLPLRRRAGAAYGGMKEGMQRYGAMWVEGGSRRGAGRVILPYQWLLCSVPSRLHFPRPLPHHSCVLASPSLLRSLPLFSSPPSPDCEPAAPPSLRGR